MSLLGFIQDSSLRVPSIPDHTPVDSAGWLSVAELSLPRIEAEIEHRKTEIRTARQHVTPIGLSELGEARLMDAEEDEDGEDEVADEESDEAGGSDEAEQGGIGAF